jgi:hypothetical protein
LKDNSVGSWIDVTGVTITYPSDLTLVKGYRLCSTYFIFSLLTDSAAKGGELYIINEL